MRKNLAHFVLSVVTEPDCPKCTQVVQNALKDEVRVQWGGLSGSLLKIPRGLHGTNFCTSSARFALSFVRHSNGSKYIQIVQNTPKHVFRVQWGWIKCIRCDKIPKRLRGTDFCTSLVLFAQSVVTQPNCPKCSQIVQNAPKHEVRVL